MENKWIQLAKSLNTEASILSARNTAENLRQLVANNLAITTELKKEIIAFGAIWPTEESHFYEFGSGWVSKRHRNQGLYSIIFSERMKIIDKLIATNNTVFSLTKNRKVIHELIKFNWCEVVSNQWDLVIPFSLSCGPCDRLNGTPKADCPFRCSRAECSMFYIC